MVNSRVRRIEVVQEKRRRIDDEMYAVVRRRRFVAASQFDGRRRNAVDGEANDDGRFRVFDDVDDVRGRREEVGQL